MNGLDHPLALDFNLNGVEEFGFVSQSESLIYDFKESKRSEIYFNLPGNSIMLRQTTFILSR